MFSITEDKIQSLIAKVSASGSIVILTHFHPDGDAIGSCVALQNILRNHFGKESKIILSSSLPDNLKFITDSCSEIVVWSENSSGAKLIDDADLIFCLDCASLSRCEEAGLAAKGSQAVKILIDHHLSPSEEEFDLVFSEAEEVSSASELLYYVLLALPSVEGKAGAIPEAARKALMTGMTTDTNNFANSVHPSTLRMASELIAAGTSRDEILEQIYNNFRENRFRAMGFMLYERMVLSDKGFAYMILDRDTRRRFDLQEGETEGLVNMPLGIAEVKISILLTEEEDRFRVSIRSKKGWSANQIARRYFNGGGHEQAAGGRLFIGKDIARANDAEAYLHRIIEES